MNRVIERIVAYAAKISDPEEIILFGSMANGTHDVHSDLDLLIIVDQMTEKSQIAGLVKRYAYELSIAADVLVRTKEEVRESRARPDSFLAGVITCGKTVYRLRHVNNEADKRSRSDDETERASSLHSPKELC